MANGLLLLSMILFHDFHKVSQYLVNEILINFGWYYYKKHMQK